MKTLSVESCWSVGFPNTCHPRALILLLLSVLSIGFFFFLHSESFSVWVFTFVLLEPNLQKLSENIFVKLYYFIHIWLIVWLHVTLYVQKTFSFGIWEALTFTSSSMHICWWFLFCLMAYLASLLLCPQSILSTIDNHYY